MDKNWHFWLKLRSFKQIIITITLVFKKNILRNNLPKALIITLTTEQKPSYYSILLKAIGNSDPSNEGTLRKIGAIL
jgi:hypothetical protein